jgi:hypothetical protein
MYFGGAKLWSPLPCLILLSLLTRGSHLGSFVDDGFQPVLLLYPEGTTINSRTLDKCRTFAQVRAPIN